MSPDDLPKELQNLDPYQLREKWQGSGQSYNEDWGVDAMYTKKIDGEWAYVQVHWQHQAGTIGLVLWSGKGVNLDD